MTIGVTGGIGSGKSTVCRLFGEWGAKLVDADRVGHEVLGDADVRQALTDAFGADIMKADGEIDRRELGRRAFVDDRTRKQLTDVVWPAIGKRLKAIVDASEAAGDATLVIEAAVLFEAGDPFGIYDTVVVVTAPEDIRIGRVQARSGLSEDEIRARMRQQMPEAEKVRRADFVVVNDGRVEDLYDEARRVWERIGAERGSGRGGSGGKGGS